MDRLIGKILKYGTLLATYGLVAAVLLQIFARFFLAQAPSWTEEAARMFFIYAVSFASGLALKNKSYVHLDLFYNKLKPQSKKLIDLGISLLTFLLFTTIAVYSFPFIGMGFAETSPSMKVKMSIVFLPVLIMSASLAYYAAIEMKMAIKALRI